MERVIYNSVTPELLDVLKIHITEGSLRRSLSMATQTIVQQGTMDVFTLYYALIDDKWSVNAIEKDILMYLLRQGVGGLDPDPSNPDPTPSPNPDDMYFIPATFGWDGQTGKTPDGAWSDPINQPAGRYGHHLIFDGEIARYDNVDETGKVGNFIGTLINLDVLMMAQYPEATITYWQNHQTLRLSDVWCDGTLPWYAQIFTSGQESRVTIQWAPGLTETFIIMVSQNSTLQGGGYPPTYEDHNPENCEG